MATVSVTQPIKPEFIAVIRSIGEIREHPAFAKLAIKSPRDSIDGASPLVPICLTQSGIVFRGLDRLEEARRSGISEIECLQFSISDQECLRQLVMCTAPVRGLNAFCRTLLALELQGELREKAAERQREGGRSKLPSNLTKACIDVRKEIAALAKVSTGSVTKAKNILEKAPTEVLEALKTGEVSIHRASKWQVWNAGDQRQELMRYRTERGLMKVIRGLLLQRRLPVERVSAGNVVTALERLQPDDLKTIEVTALKIEGRRLIATEELLRLLETQGRLIS